MKKLTTKKLVATALFMALTIVATMFIRIPLPLVGYVNLGDVFIFLSVFILGPLCGALVGGVGAGTIMIGVGFVLSGIFFALSELLQSGVYSTVGGAILIVGIVVGLVISFAAMFKYNKGIF